MEVTHIEWSQNPLNVYIYITFMAFLKLNFTTGQCENRNCPTNISKSF